MRITWVKSDITRLAVDAVVTAANAALAGGGGVDGAIHRAAGPGLLDACRQLGGCPTGDARITSGCRLPARWIIHAVGPIWRGGSHDEARLLAAAYASSLALAHRHACRRVAFPAISCGVYGYPIAQAMAIAIATMRAWRESFPEVVVVAAIDREVITALQTLLGAPSDPTRIGS